MALAKNRNVFWFDVRVNGRRIRGSTGCRNRTEAKAFERDLIEKLVGCKTVHAIKDAANEVIEAKVGGTRVTLQAAWDLFREQPARRKAGAQREHATQMRWLDFLAFMNERYPDVSTLAEVSPAAARQYIGHIQQHGRWNKQIQIKARRGHPGFRLRNPDAKNPRPRKSPAMLRDVEFTFEHKIEKLSPAMQREYLATCRMVLDRIMPLDRAISENPFTGIELAGKPGGGGGRDYFDVDAIYLLYEAAQHHHERAVLLPVIVMGAGLALRLSDIATLRWEHVDFTGGMVSKSQEKTGRLVSVPLWDDELIRFLQEAKAAQPGATPADCCFPVLAALYRNNRCGISYRFKRFLSQNGYQDKATVAMKDRDGNLLRDRAVSRLDIHALRHSFAAIAGAAGIPLQTVQAILGHTSPKTTEIYMAHVRDAEKREKLRAMPKLFGGSPRLLSMSGIPDGRNDLQQQVARLTAAADDDTLRKIFSLLGK